jgi:prepilin-type N-terminal cleavage/methylation domain-containing protein
MVGVVQTFETMQLKLRTNQRRRAAGFTLAEVLIAVGVGGIIFVTIYAGLGQCFRSVKSSQHRLRATQILVETMEVIRLYNWDQINQSGFVPATVTEIYNPSSNSSGGIIYTVKLTVTNAPVDPAYTNTMRRAIADATWVSGGITNRQRMETLISQYGIQNYIY